MTRRLRSLALLACAGFIAGTVTACTDDTSTPATDAASDSTSNVPETGTPADAATTHDASPESSTTDGPTEAAKTDASPADGGVADSALPDAAPSEASTVSDASPEASHLDAAPDSTAASEAGPVDAGNDADATVPPPAPLNMCGVLDALWNGNRYTNAYGWVDEIAGGSPDAPYSGYTGFTNTVTSDCAVENLFQSVDWTTWPKTVEAFAQTFFGCGGDAGAAAFTLVPGGQTLTTADVKHVGDWFIDSVVWAVSYQALPSLDGGAAPNPNAVLTADQISAIETQMTYYESLYHPVIASSAYSSSACPVVDAGGGG